MRTSRTHVSSPDLHTAALLSPPRNTATDHPRMNSPGPSPVDIQNHLYASFLEARTADVALRVRGTWEAIYKLHRVVLIQSGFFRSLFTAGFVESSPRLGGHYRGPDEIDIVFDDRNITRAAFEICISRLYGGGPPLYMSPLLMPTSSQPLTPSFPTSPPQIPVPKGHHPATPRFLLSLLATAVYLAIPSVALQALNSIISSIGPHTVIQYLNFALGHPVGGPQGDEPEAAIGLEHVAQPIPEESHHSVQTTKGELDEPVTISSTLQGLEVDIDVKTPSEIVSPSDSVSLNSDDSTSPEDGPLSHYGNISDKLGEAVACWLARWGPDMFPFEQQKKKKSTQTSSTTTSAPHMRRRARTVPGPYEEPDDSPSARISVPSAIPVIWDRQGLKAKWVVALISSDLFFIRGERERYDFAKSVVEFRRAGGINEAEESEWSKLFEHGIYYANMSTEDIITISQDVSPSTGRLFVPLAVLQAAHWSQSVLRHHITVKPSSSSYSPTLTSSPLPREKELGITDTTADILARLSSNDDIAQTQEKAKTYYPIPKDSSVRLGVSGEIEGTTIEQLFEVSSPSRDAKPVPQAVTSERNFFGLLPERHTASSCVKTDTSGKQRWSTYAPFRFSVEFWDVDSLKEKSRLHSHTIWYAGSLFNVYVQIVKKKGVQLGVYLHRQSSIDPIPPSSAPLMSRDRELHHNRIPSLPSTLPLQQIPSSPSVHHPPLSRTTTPQSAPSTSLSNLPSYSGAGTNYSSIPATAAPITPPQPYRDPRASISAYFTISCASITGSTPSLTRFTSSPDVFSVSQSWGWKSSSLIADQPEGQSQTSSVAQGKEVSLRATVVLGVV